MRSSQPFLILWEGHLHLIGEADQTKSRSFSIQAGFMNGWFCLVRCPPTRLPQPMAYDGSISTQNDPCQKLYPLKQHPKSRPQQKIQTRKIRTGKIRTRKTRTGKTRLIRSSLPATIRTGHASGPRRLRVPSTQEPWGRTTEAVTHSITHFVTHSATHF